ncbi:hypothetical protein D9619_001794 [Psilocybe cf. subviscida]|uniref:Carrier domain-containing protein n=1 Tax=Psilocybe cf. subviscida TaxID=2480587 RepID=A0A8H5BFS1_9AGAR|nr:hypothetical protein D9619_001794 [Psilocybe cf. subviscida]
MIMRQLSYAVNAVIPPIDGTVTLPETLDFHNKHNPNYHLFSFHTDGAEEITHINYFEFRRAADRVAHHLRPGRRGPEGEIIAVVALADTLLYHASTLGMMRGGIIPFLMSPRNSAPAIVKMLKEVSCHKLLTTQETLKSIVTEVVELLEKDNYALEVIEMPPLFEIFPHLGSETAADPFEEYPKAAVRPGLDDAMLYLHSSGSTGFPKSIKETYRIFCHWAAFGPMPELSGWKIGCMALPPFHTLGVIIQIIHSMYGLSTVLLYPPVASKPSQLPIMPTPDNILDHLRRTKAESLVTIPTLLQIWGQDQEAVDYLATLKLVGYSGGPVPTKLGNFMASSGVKLSPVYGGTEFGGPTYMLSRPGYDPENDWEWMSLDDRMNVRWDPQGDGTYECQLLTCETHQLSVENMPGEKGYATADLFIPHPVVPNYWKIVGRKDDVIIHTSGEKTVPAPMENIIMTSGLVMGVVIFGREHDQPGVLIELKVPHAIDPTDEAAVVAARNSVWSIIDEANRIAPSFSRIFKEMILFSDPKKPLPRAGKGTVMRKAALTLYNDEVEALYATIESTAGAEAVPPPTAWTQDETGQWLKEQIQDIVPSATFNIETDLFEQGMDSLAATILRRRIVGALQFASETTPAAEFINQNTIYSHPTIESLSEFILAVIVDPSSAKAEVDRAQAVEDMIAKYNAGLDKPIAAGEAHNGAQALITGTTGNLGSQIMETLLQDDSVTRIWALNRPSGKPLAKHVERFTDKGLNIELLSHPKLVFLESDLTQKNLGLEDAVYQELRNNVTVIMHNAWRLDFNLQLGSFEPNIRGTRNLIDLARSSRFGANTKFMFTSSVAQGLSWDRSKGAYPEEIPTEAVYSTGSGYGESKYVAERILAQSGIKGTSFRVGQITGGKPNGAWAISDWVPILVKSSIVLGILPLQAGVTSWVPMDAVASTILDVALGPNSPKAINLVHPRPVQFDSLVEDINNTLVSQGIVEQKLRAAPIQEWFSLLEPLAEGASDEDIKQVPAIKLLEFFRATANADEALRSGQLLGNESGGMADFSTKSAQSVSKTMRDLPSIGAGHVDMWVKYWKSAGLFN